MASKGKSPVLGNDPFERGAASRPEPETAGVAAPTPRRAAPKKPARPAKPPRRKPAPSAKQAPVSRSSTPAATVRKAPPPRTALPSAPPPAQGQAPSVAAEPARSAVWVGASTGVDASLDERVGPVLDFLYDRYFRLSVSGAENLPAGGSLLVCNHGGALPLDGLMMRTALRRGCGRPEARWLLEDLLCDTPLLGPLLTGLGGVRASPQNVERLLADGCPLAAFPEGAAGLGKRFGERYRLQRFGHGGFVRLALRAGAPLLPVAILGAEESSPLLAQLPLFGAGRPCLPLTPTFPWLGPLGLVPLPIKWHISILPPVPLDGMGPAAADDASAVARLTEQVREAVQVELDRLLAARRSPWSG